jgi:HlyD family secretion protein
MAVKKKIRIIAVVLVALALIATFAARRFWNVRSSKSSITLYGNVDIRQVQLAFNDSERIDKLLVDEGSAVHAGQLVAQLAPQRFRDTVARYRADVAEQRQVVARLLAGSRPEEIARARADLAAAQADVEAAKAELENAKALYRRRQALAAKQYVSLQVRDDALRGMRVALAGLDTKQKIAAAKAQVLRLAVIGARKEDIAAAKARLQSEIALLATAKKDLADTQLYAPASGVIQDRLLEPGDMATPQTPVFTLALDDPVWVRAYLPEPLLGKAALGMKAWITTDGFPGKRFKGWVGFISPVAEFTPKSVETTQLRSQLVYRVRIFACNPDHRLRLGMPATVTIPLVDNPAHAVSPHPCETR